METVLFSSCSHKQLVCNINWLLDAWGRLCILNLLRWNVKSRKSAQYLMHLYLIVNLGTITAPSVITLSKPLLVKTVILISLSSLGSGCSYPLQTANALFAQLTYYLNIQSQKKAGKSCLLAAVVSWSSFLKQTPSSYMKDHFLSWYVCCCRKNWSCTRLQAVCSSCEGWKCFLTLIFFHGVG